MDFNIRDRRAIFNLAEGWDKQPSLLHRLMRWVEDARVNGNRKVLALVIGGGAAVSLGVGMMLGGALEGVDIALPPPAHPGPGPIIDYASPTTAHAHQHSSRPATSATGSKRSSTSTTTAGSTVPDTTTTAVLTGTVSTDPTTTTPPPKTPGSTTTTVPSTPTTTTPPGGGGSGGSPTPIQNFFHKLTGN